MDTVKIEPIDDHILVLLDFDENVCDVVDFSDTSDFSYKTKHFNPVLVSVAVDRIPHNSFYMKLVCHGSLS